MARRLWKFVGVAGAGAAVALLVGAPAGEYAEATSCATCHAKIWETYQRTGMGRAFGLPTPENTPVGSFYHQASESQFTIEWRDGKAYQRRHQVDAAGRVVNVFEKSVDFILGSGNHARTFLHRTERGTLLELPLGWYAEKGGSLDMNPGYDRADHDGFRRRIGYDCMFCHNGYPKIPAGHERSFAEPVYQDPLPMGIDCQRCHGPGARHVAVAGTAGGGLAAIRGAIVNPARLSAERREELCIQCHLEATSFPLPNSLPRYGRGPFGFRPGEPLEKDWLFFDHAPEAGRGDKFEIVNAVYRMRKSACYLQSGGALSCMSCHNPHDVPRGAEAVRQYDAACRKCHGEPFAKTVAAGKHTAQAGCADCHMPKRRTEDVVHSAATDHWVQRRPPVGNLLAARRERHELGASAYRGEVVLHYPEKLAATAENELYLALAQVVDKSNLKAGIARLEKAIAKSPTARAEFYLGLAEALQSSGQLARALPVYREAVRRDGRSAFLQWKLGGALRHAGQLAEAVAVLQRAVALAPKDTPAWHELGLALQSQGKSAEAVTALRKAIALDPNLPEPHGNLGVVYLAAGDTARAAEAFREAIRIQPDSVDAHSNLANLLAGSGDFAGARMHYETALRLRPADAVTHYNFGMALGRARLFAEAERELQAAVRGDGGYVAARQRLAEMLMAKGDARGALVHYRELVRLQPESGGALLGLGATLAMTGDAAGGVPYLRKAAASADAEAREQAAQLLQQMGAPK